LAYLGSSQKLKSYLSHSKLRVIIRQINSSKYRKKSLQKMMDGDPDFLNFVDLMLEEMGYLKKGVFTCE
jgi:hypothetical protein